MLQSHGWRLRALKARREGTRMRRLLVEEALDALTADQRAHTAGRVPAQIAAPVVEHSERAADEGTATTRQGANATLLGRIGA